MENRVITVQPIDITAINEQTKDVEPLKQYALTIKIATQEDYYGAGEFLKKVKGKIKELDDRRKCITNPLDVAKKAVMDLFRVPVETLESLETTVKREMIVYVSVQEKIRREQEAKRQEEQRKEQEKLQAKAQILEEYGKVEQAEALRQQAEVLQMKPVSIPQEPVKVEGISFSEKWSAVVTDVNKIPREYLIPNMDALQKMAQATKGVVQIPGIEWKCEKVVRSRS